MEFYKSKYTAKGSSLSALNYRFGYQGSEKDNEVNSSNGSSYTTEFRQLDTRLGRWFSSDPVFQPWQSSYTSMDNNPINLTDVLGDVTGDVVSEDGKGGRVIEGKDGKHIIQKQNENGEWEDKITVNPIDIVANKTPSQQKQEQAKTKWYNNILSNIKSFAISQFKKLTISKEKPAESPKEQKTLGSRFVDWLKKVDDGGVMIYGGGKGFHNLMGSNQGGHYRDEKNYEISEDEFGGIGAFKSLLAKAAFAKYGKNAMPYVAAFYYGVGLTETADNAKSVFEMTFDVKDRASKKFKFPTIGSELFSISNFEIEKKVQQLKRDTVAVFYENHLRYGRAWVDAIIENGDTIEVEGGYKLIFIK